MSTVENHIHVCFAMTARWTPAEGDACVLVDRRDELQGRPVTITAMPAHPNTWIRVRLNEGGRELKVRTSSLSPLVVARTVSAVPSSSSSASPLPTSGPSRRVRQSPHRTPALRRPHASASVLDRATPARLLAPASPLSVPAPAPAPGSPAVAVTPPGTALPFFAHWPLHTLAPGAHALLALSSLATSTAQRSEASPAS